MKVMVQWAIKHANDYLEVDSRDWADLPKKPEPTGNEVIDDKRGWLARINVQGMGFMGDHIAVIHNKSFVKVVQWDDDPEDWKPDEFVAVEWTFYEVKNRGSGKPGVLQYATHYYSPARIEAMTKLGHLPIYNISSQENIKIKEYSEFVKPDEKYIKHGIWLENNLWEKIHAFPRPKWMDWIGNSI